MDDKNTPQPDHRLALVQHVVEVVSGTATDQVKVHALIAIADICASPQPVNVTMHGGAGAKHTVNLGKV